MAGKISQDDKELLSFAKNELKKLHRQYIIMENDKKSYATEIKNHIEKQRQIIKTLEKEHDELELKLTAISDIERKSKYAFKEFTQLTEKYEVLHSQIKDKKLTIKKLNNEIWIMKKKVNVTIPVISLETYELSNRLPKKSNMVQNKLHNATVKFNNILSENAALRTNVNMLLRDRARFNNLYKTFLTKLKLLKKKCLDLIEQATTACDQRAELETKLKTIVEQDQHNRITHYHEMKDMHRRLNHLIQLQEFFSTKGQNRIMADLQMKVAEKQQETLKNQEETVKRDKHILQQIKLYCDEEEEQKLSAIFVEQEEENFALFNYINEIQNELETLQDEVKTFSIALDQHRLSSRSQMEQQNDSKEHLTDQLDHWRGLLDEEQKQIDRTNANIDLIFRSTEQLFKLTKCDNVPVLRLTGILLL